MTARQIIDMAVAYSGITKTDLAKGMGWSPQLLGQRIGTGKFTVDEWTRLADVLGAQAKIGFAFADGTFVGRE